MAGIAIPDNLRPAVAAVAKHHFWILAALVPLVLVPLLVVGTGGLRGRIAEQRRQIEAKRGQAQRVARQEPHPNEGWVASIDADTAATERETLDEWRRFWHSQLGLRVWPAELGEPFLADVANLKPGGKLDRQSLVRYQNMAPRLARTLPARMGVADGMAEPPADAGGGPRPGPGAAPLAPALTWSPASQKRLYDSFVWGRVPTTTQVLLAQEELWVYGLFCDLLAGFVKEKNATGAHDSPLTFVDDLAVGFPALVASDPARRENHIFVPRAAAGQPGMPPPDMGLPPEPAGASQVRWHPRFVVGGAGGPAPLDPAAPADQPPRSPDDDYRSWIYVDFAGKPLMAADLAAPEARMVHLMPFVLRVTIDQRHLDRLLVALAASPVPIDVRQVRVNPGAAGGQIAVDGPPQGDGRPAGARPHDMLVELRGSVALATRPDAASDTQPPPGTTP